MSRGGDGCGLTGDASLTVAKANDSCIRIEMAVAANASRRTGILQTFLTAYALVVGAGLLLGGTDHISWNIDFLATTRQSGRASIFARCGGSRGHGGSGRVAKRRGEP
jgi:hypothetical protein